MAGMNGELSVSRSFGDKKYIHSGLIADPEITKIELTKDALYLIMATDGFWNVKIHFSNQFQCISLPELSHFVKLWSKQQQPNENLSSFLID